MGITLDFLKQMAKAISTQFGDHCEVVIHDLTRKSLRKSIVYIENGDVSNRKIGDGPSRIVLEALKKPPEKLKDQLGYLIKTDNGKTLKSSTIFVREEGTNQVRYILSINYDITNLLYLEESVHSLTACSESANSIKKGPEHIAQNVNDLLDDLIEQSVSLVGKPVTLMNKEDKVAAIQFLNDTGAFLITKSGDKVSKYFGISKYTLYSYIDINKQ
ncbi:helix-turn-helix transcriptional regulator [Lachnospiraceae bacterium ZAX-1]